jgi:short subunit dehydrogenase-like uncharacterized protein
MPATFLLYGATGYSGRLIAAEAARARDKGGLQGHMVLAGRNADEVKRLARQLNFESRAFGLDHRAEVQNNLKGVNVLINAAGPFAWTAERLVKSAIETGCHYVDINGEVDVYKHLDDFARSASQRELTLVSSAGHMSATSDLMLDAALCLLKRRTRLDRLGCIRIALSRIVAFSRGSGDTVLRSMREQVLVLRQGKDADDRRYVPPVLWHVPAGFLERTFDFGAKGKAPGARPDLRIASAVNLVDTMIARQELVRYRARIKQLETYMETTAAGRVGFQLGAVTAPFLAALPSCPLKRAALSLLPAGPSEEERRRIPHSVVLQIEDDVREPLIDWRLETPNVYDLTAQTTLAVAERLAEGGPPGWRTPAEMLGPVLQPGKRAQTGALRGCLLEDRLLNEPA